MSSYRKLGTLACILAVTCVLLLRGAPAASAADVRVWIEPVQAKGEFSADFTVQVMIENVTDLGYFQFTLEYDPGVVLAKGAVLGDFLGSTGRSTSGLGPRFDNSKGTLTFGGFSFGTPKGPDGKGVLAEVTFTGLARGVSPLRLKNVLVSDSNNQSIKGFTVQEGVAAVGGAPVVTPDPTATPVMATMTPLSLPTALLTSVAMATAEPQSTQPPASVVPEASGTGTVQATPPSEPLLTATTVPAATPPGAVGTVPPGQAATATPAVAGAAAPAAVGATTATPAAPGIASVPASTAPVSAEGAPTAASTPPTPALAAGARAQPTRAATSAPILSGSAPGSTPQGSEAPDDDSARGAPAWLVAAGIGVIGLACLAAVGLVILAFFWTRRRKDA